MYSECIFVATGVDDKEEDYNPLIEVLQTMDDMFPVIFAKITRNIEMSILEQDDLDCVMDVNNGCIVVFARGEKTNFKDLHINGKTFSCCYPNTSKSSSNWFDTVAPIRK